MSTPELYLSRARLRRDVPAAALRALLVPEQGGARAGTGHQLVWTLFADAPDRRRDFLWREADGGAFYLLSRRVPEDRHGLFELDPPKPFAPSFATGDRLGFTLRANATVARKQGTGSARGKPCDIVMDAIHALPRGERAGPRQEVLARVAREWLSRQGAARGFELVDAPSNEHGDDDEGWEGSTHPGIRVLGYRVLRVDRGRNATAMSVGVLDLEGTLRVCDPATFVAAIGHGFGRAKAFGCGLMLVRRAR